MAEERFTEFTIDYDLIDLTALDDAVITTSSNKSFADIQKLKNDEEFPDYLTWEHNHNLLNGDLTHFEQNTYTSNSIAFFSNEKSNAEGTFTNNPIIEIRFSNPHSSIGLTLNFVSDYPMEAIITWYSYGEVIISNTYTITSKSFFIPEAVKLYDTITIEFSKSVPDRYIKFYFMLFGKKFNWDETVVKSGNLVQEVNMLSDKLSLNSLSFEIIDIDNTLNFGNSANIIEYFVRNQPMYPKITIDNNELKLGKYYLDVVTSDNNIAKINAFSAIGLLDTIPFNEGLIYSGTLAGLVLSRIFELAGISSYYIDNTTYNIPLFGTIKPCTCREALQKVLFVTGGIARTNSDEYQIIVEQPSTSLGSKITRAEKISTKVSDLEYVTGIKLSYTIFEKKSEAEKIVTDTYDAGQHTIVFSKPYDDAYLSESGVTVNAVSTYYITFTLTTRMTLTIYGTSYEESSNDITINRTVIKSGAIENVKPFSTELCDYLRAMNLAYKLLNYYISSSLNIEIKCLASNNSMSGKQIVFNSTEGLSNYVGRYSSRVFNLTGGFIDDAKLIGYYASASSDEYYTTQFAGKQDMFTGDYLI